MDAPFDSWQTTAERVPEKVVTQGILLAPGDRVRLTPRPGADVFDLILQGKIATITSIELDFEGQVYLAVTIDDDPGRDLGGLAQPAHRFFYRLDDVQPLADAFGSDH
jgi:hypothetical protein